MTTQFMVFQCGYCSLGFGSNLFDAVEDSQQWIDSPSRLCDEIECYDNVKPHVDGGIYWTTTDSVINEYKLNQQ